MSIAFCPQRKCSITITLTNATKIIKDAFIEDYVDF